MALRTRGKKKFYHAYFRTVKTLEDGTLLRGMTTVNLGTTDLQTAKALEAELLQKQKKIRLFQKVKAHQIRMEIDAGESVETDLPQAVIQHRKKHLLISDALSVAEKYRKLGTSAQRIWRSFCRDLGRRNVRYMHQVSPEMAFSFLNGREGKSGKTFNNLKHCLNKIFTLTMIESGIQESPFARIPNRSLDSRHQRSLTEEEFLRLFHAAPEPWKSASLIAWWTGLREKDIFTLEWEEIQGDCIVTKPAKTARFGRSVRIPIHPQLMVFLRTIPRSGSRILGAWPYCPQNSAWRKKFSSLLQDLNITETADGIVNFNSIRDSFVTRMDSAGLPRHAIRGMVGHVEDTQTDLYSHDLVSARQLQSLPDLELGKKV